MSNEQNKAFLNSQFKQLADSKRRSICTLLGWTESKYGELLLDEGERWLEMHNGGKQSPQFIEMRRNSYFWDWWLLQWIKLDLQFIALFAGDSLSGLTEQEAENYYLELHDAAKMATRWPHRVILERGYKNIQLPRT